MPKAKIMGATCKEEAEVTLSGTTKVVATTNAVLISAINISLPLNVGGTAKADTVVVYDSDDNVKFRLNTGASGEGFVSFPAPLLSNGIKVSTTATVVGKVTFYTIS